MARNLSVERLPATTPGVEGEPLRLEIALRGRAWLASRVELRDRIGPLGERRIALGRRGEVALLRVAKARALAAGRSFVSPDDVKAIAEPVLAHRLIVAPEARSTGLGPAELVRDAIEKTPVPV